MLAALKPFGFSVNLEFARATSYFKGKDSLWVKVVSSGDSDTGAPGGGTSLQVSR